ncbi:MAG: hypothetical protein AAFX02_04545 [Pseudomonadota bacterium]
MTDAIGGQSRPSPGTLLIALTILTLVMSFLMPLAPFTIDEATYAEMARAMAEQGALSISPSDRVAEAPTLLRTFTHNVTGEAMPQYPSGYAVIAAPFYAAMGLRGLILLNAISFLAATYLTWRIGRHLYQTPEVALYGTLIFAGGSFASNYAVGIWPHMLTLALVLAGIERLAAAPHLRERSQWLAYAGAGLALGAAVNLRVDVILAMLGALIWIRLFSEPGKRHLAIIFIVGLLPGLLIAASLNQAKFEIFSPLAYGPPDANEVSDRYWLQYLIVGVTLPLLLLLDFSRSWTGYVTGALRRRRVLMGVTGAALLAILIIPPLRKLAWNIYVLTADVQRIDVAKFYSGMFRNDAGFISFRGEEKTALLQSLPFLGLLIVPIFAFLRKRDASAHALSFGMIAGPVLFYALTQWHGGFSFNMRYFLPALPFISLLTGYAIQHLLVHERLDANRLRQTILISIIAVFALGTLASQTGGLMRGIYVYYLPMLIAAALLTLLLLPRDMQSYGQYKQTTTICVSAALGWAAVAGFDDVMDLRSRLSQHKAFVEGYARLLPEDSLVFSDVEEYMLGASLKGTHVAKFDMPDVWQQTVTAYSAADRCVYFHASASSIQLVEAAGIDLVKPFGEDAPIHARSLHLPASQANDCTPKL